MDDFKREIYMLARKLIEDAFEEGLDLNLGICCACHVPYLCVVANCGSLYIRSRTAAFGSFFMRMYLGDKHFGKSIGDKPAGHGF